MNDSAERWHTLEEVFQAALKREPAQREAFLEESCPDADLRREIKSLLDAGASADEILEQPAIRYAFHTLEAGSMLGQYRIEERIGAGGMGEVYRAKDTRLGRAVAIKALPAFYGHDPAWLARFQYEARVLASLNHPQIAAIYGLEESGQLAIAMELVEGPTLADRLARGALPIAEVLAIARQIAEALEYAHDRGVIHCDLKPANIKTSLEGAVKVLDFGLAKAAGESEAAPTPARAGTILGTPAYMAPEQAAGVPADRRVDIWSFGVVLFEMLAGRPVFQELQRDKPNWQYLPPETPSGIHRLLRRCLDPDPRQRLRDIGEARIAIETEQRGGAPESAPIAPAKVSRSLTAAIAAILSLLAALAWAWASGWLLKQPTALGAARLQIAYPDGAASCPDRYAPNSVPSPDGKFVAFIAVSDGRNYLWVQALDSVNAQRLDQTEGAHLPFWSPDGKSIAFFARGQLKRISTAGGTPQVICAGSGAGGTWSTAGVVLFSSGGRAGLMRVPAGGGDPVVVTRPDPLRGETGHAWPQFLPDGRHFLYFASEGGAAGSIYLQELGSSHRTLVLKTPWRAVLASGRLLIVRRHLLLAQPFDLETFQLYGEAVPLLPQVNAQPGGFSTPVAASENGVIAYRSDDGTPLLTWYDRDGQAQGTVRSAADFSGPALSPDGRWLAVAIRQPATEKRDIWLFDLLRGATLRMTNDSADDMNPTWSPDGRRIAFTSDRRGPRETYLKDPFGTSPEELISAETGGGENVDDWSPDGHSLAYETFPGKQHISLLSLDNRQTRPYTFAGEHRARFSPDGEWVAYQSPESGNLEVYIQPLPATGAKWQISTGGGYQPQWRGDGKELFYALDAFPTTIMAVDIALTGEGIQAGIPHALFSVPMTLDGRNGFVVTRDGKRFMVIVPQKQKGAASLSLIFNWPALLEKR